MAADLDVWPFEGGTAPTRVKRVKWSLTKTAHMFAVEGRRHCGHQGGGASANPSKNDWGPSFPSSVEHYRTVRVYGRPKRSS